MKAYSWPSKICDAGNLQKDTIDFKLRCAILYFCMEIRVVANCIPVSSSFRLLFYILWLYSEAFVSNSSSSSEHAIPNRRSTFFFPDFHDKLIHQYPQFSDAELKQSRDDAKDMFDFGYSNYLRYAFPMDELDPIHCAGRGPDYENPSNININDALGDYCLTLVDSLDTLAVMGDSKRFREAVDLVIDYVSFNKDITVQVFEANIRVLGALLSAHLILRDPIGLFPDMKIPNYSDELLTLAHDLASRLLPAFENSKTGLPHPRVNFLYGTPWNSVNQTCTAGAGSLLLEFGVLSRLLGDPTYESLARRTNQALWSLRDPGTGLLGNIVDIQTGEWHGQQSGLGAGADSFFEYLLKSYILFGDPDDYRMFNESYSTIFTYQRRGRRECNRGAGDPPLYVNVHMRDGQTANTWIDSLQASFAGVHILNGDIDEAICHHALYYSIWKKFGLLPERYNWQLKSPDVRFYPLRPEFAESTYFLYLSTGNPFYLHVGREIMASLNEHTKVECGYATVHDVNDKSLEDRMESFFLSETCKYLFLLFDVDNRVNKNYEKLLFTTEGHVFPIHSMFRTWPLFSDKDKAVSEKETTKEEEVDLTTSTKGDASEHVGTVKEEEEATASLFRPISPSSQSTFDNHRQPRNSSMQLGCDSFERHRRFTLPLHSKYLEQLYKMVGYEFDFGRGDLGSDS